MLSVPAIFFRPKGREEDSNAAYSWKIPSTWIGSFDSFTRLQSVEN